MLAYPVYHDPSLTTKTNRAKTSSVPSFHSRTDYPPQEPDIITNPLAALLAKYKGCGCCTRNLEGEPALRVSRFMAAKTLSHLPQAAKRCLLAFRSAYHQFELQPLSCYQAMPSPASRYSHSAISIHGQVCEYHSAASFSFLVPSFTPCAPTGNLQNNSGKAGIPPTLFLSQSHLPAHSFSGPAF